MNKGSPFSTSFPAFVVIVFLLTVILTGARRILKAVLVIIFLMAEDAKHIFSSYGLLRSPFWGRCIPFISLFADGMILFRRLTFCWAPPPTFLKLPAEGTVACWSFGLSLLSWFNLLSIFFFFYNVSPSLWLENLRVTCPELGFTADRFSGSRSGCHSWCSCLLQRDLWNFSSKHFSSVWWLKKEKKTKQKKQTKRQNSK